MFLSLGEAFHLSNDASFTFYSDRLYVLYHAAADDKQIRCKGNAFSVAFKDSVLWLPGCYFLLFRSGNTILRFDVQLDEHGTFTETGARQCQQLSDEDILSGVLTDRPHWIRYFSKTPGLMQWKRWLITRLQHRAFNAIRAQECYSELDYCNNLLISSPTSDYLSRNIVLLRHLAEIKCEVRSSDCEMIYHPDSGNPCYEIDELFRNDEEEEILGISLPSTKPRIFTLKNIGALLEPGKERGLERVLDHCPSCYDSGIFCGTQEDIRHLLEREPSLHDKFPEYNRLAVEPYTLDEVIRLFFFEVGLARLNFSPEATDAACQMLIDRYQQGSLHQWRLAEIRHYLQGQVIPAYTRRAISSIQQGVTPSEVLDIQVEDLSCSLF